MMFPLVINLVGVRRTWECSLEEDTASRTLDSIGFDIEDWGVVTVKPEIRDS